MPTPVACSQPWHVSTCGGHEFELLTCTWDVQSCHRRLRPFFIGERGPWQAKKGQSEEGEGARGGADGFFVPDKDVASAQPCRMEDGDEGQRTSAEDVEFRTRRE